MGVARCTRSLSSQRVHPPAGRAAFQWHRQSRRGCSWPQSSTSQPSLARPEAFPGSLPSLGRRPSRLGRQRGGAKLEPPGRVKLANARRVDGCAAWRAASVRGSVLACLDGLLAASPAPASIRPIAQLTFHRGPVAISADTCAPVVRESVLQAANCLAGKCSLRPRTRYAPTRAPQGHPRLSAIPGLLAALSHIPRTGRRR